MAVDDVYEKSSAALRKYFVREDGRFVGAFEELYRNCEDPWVQSVEAFRSPFKKLIIMQIAQLSERRVIDIGCGDGTYTDLIRSGANADVLGFDVAQTAVQKARSKYPLCRFEVACASEVAKFQDMKPTALVMCGLTWCILDSFEEVLASVKKHFSGSLLFHTLTFYAPGKQKYGNEYFTSLDELIPYFSDMTVEETFVHRLYPNDGSYNTLVVARI